MQLQALTLPLYPALLYRRRLLDRLLLRAPRIAVNPLGRLQTSTDATLKITGFAEELTMDLQGGFSLHLSAEPRGSISELSLRIGDALSTGHPASGCRAQRIGHAPELDLSDPKRDLAERILRRLNDVLNAWPGRADQSEPWE